MKESDFAPLDRLIELGLGLSISRQMAGTMNQYLNSIKMSEEYLKGKRYWFVVGGRQAGPFSEDEIVLLIRNKVVDRDTLSWSIGLSKWRKSEEDSYLLGLILKTFPSF